MPRLLIFLLLISTYGMTSIVCAQDSDGDGIADTSDLDDDNDGIPDDDELSFTESVVVSPASAGLIYRDSDGNPATNIDYSYATLADTDISSNYGLPAGALVLSGTNVHTRNTGVDFNQGTDWATTTLTLSSNASMSMYLEHGPRMQITNANPPTKGYTITAGGTTFTPATTNTSGGNVNITETSAGNTYSVQNQFGSFINSGTSFRWDGDTYFSSITFDIFSDEATNGNFFRLYVTLSFVDGDQDGHINTLDLDSDNDGIPDIVEAGGVDADGDGRVDNFVDTDNDGLSDQYDPDNGGTALSIPNSDSDGNADPFDIDSDGDGLIDLIESQASTNSPATPSGVDSDSDGIDDSFDTDSGNSLTIPVDTDEDGTPDYMDTDADNFEQLDAIEGWDTNNDGSANTTPSGTDSDSDGLDDNFDNVSGLNATTNVTNGGQTALAFPDLDGNTLELDWREQIITDWDGDGIADGSDDDDDNDGILDTDEGFGSDLDSDGDLVQDYFDIDSDNDGIEDITEAQLGPTGYVAPAGVDTDNDGLDDAYDTDCMPCGGITGIAITPVNSEMTGDPDYLDSDSDDDGENDWTEGFDDDGSGDALNDLIARAATFEAAAGDPGYYDNSIDSNSNGIPDWLESGAFLSYGNVYFRDTDQDGLIDLFDTDNSGASATPSDGDGDGVYDFRDGDNSVTLPIILLYFDISQLNETVELEWATASETNNDYFTIERSVDGLNWNDLFKIAGAGNSTEKIVYQFVDRNLLYGVSYYRLRQTDFDGNFEVFSSLLVNNLSINSVAIFPNPVNNGSFSITIDSSLGSVPEISIVDLVGKQVNFSSEAVITGFILTFTDYVPQGIYFVNIKSKSSLIKRKIRVQ